MAKKKKNTPQPVEGATTQNQRAIGPPVVEQTRLTDEQREMVREARPNMSGSPVGPGAATPESGDARFTPIDLSAFLAGLRENGTIGAGISPELQAAILGSQSGGSRGGSGGGTRSSGSSRGGSGGGTTPGGVNQSDPDLSANVSDEEQQITSLLARLVSGDMTSEEIFALDPSFAQRSQEILGNIEADRGQLLNLDPEAAAQLEAMTQAELALHDRNFQNRSQGFLASIFGRGAEQSTTSGLIGQQLLGDQSLVEQQALAAGGSRVLNARQFLTENNLANLSLQLQGLDSERAAELSNLGLQSDQVQRGRDRRASMLDSMFGRRSAEEQTRIGAQAQVRSSRIGADAQIQSSRISANATITAARANANAMTRSAQISADASRAGALARLQGTQYASDQQLAGQLAGLEVSQNQFGADLDYRYYDTDTGARLQEQQLQFERDQAAAQRRANSRNQILGTLGTLAQGIGAAGGIASFFSDAALKDDIQPIADAVEKLRLVPGVEWKWNHSIHGTEVQQDVPSAGILAQDLRSVRPDCVTEHSSGYLQVDYTGVIGLLVAAVNELADKVDTLYARSTS